jgi:hypothetical protein
MTKILKLFVISTAFVGLTAGAAWADSPHFIGTPQATVSGNSLNITASVAGLGTADSAEFSLTGDVNVFSRCYNKGGNKPQADNKQETIAVDQDQSFPVRNGRTNISFTVTPLSTLTCPGNQVVVIESVTYDLTLSGEGLSFNFTS